jgi:RNA polymerase sigma-70 factor, ECF subfamily
MQLIPFSVSYRCLDRSISLEQARMVITERTSFSERLLSDGELEDWVRRSRSGDLAAFDSLVGRYYRIVFNLAFRMLGSREAAEDAAQEIFLKAWRGLGQFRGASRFSTWLHSIAVRHCINRSRVKSAEGNHIQPMSERNSRGDYEDSFEGDVPLEQWHRTQAIREAIAALPDKVQTVIVLHYYSDYTVKEIAAALDLSMRAVYARLEQGRSRLGQHLKDIGEAK